VVPNYGRTHPSPQILDWDGSALQRLLILINGINYCYKKFKITEGRSFCQPLIYSTLLFTTNVSN
jgi:hypothetical protein